MALFLSILGLVFGIVGIIPFLGFLEWVAIVIAALGTIFGIIGIVVKKQKGSQLAAVIINILVFLLALVRILVGLGVFIAW